MPSINITPERLKGAAPVVLPIVALYFLKITAAPVPTLAGPQAEEIPATPPVRLVQPGEESRRCAEWAERQRLAVCGDSPFFYPDSEEFLTDPDPLLIEEQADLPPVVVLEGVMGSGKHLVALIDGELHSLGDSVEGGWTIRTIDVNSRTVTLAHADGREFVLATER